MPKDDTMFIDWSGFKKYINNLGKEKERLFKAAALGCAAGLENTMTEIRRSVLGSKVWSKNKGSARPGGKQALWIRSGLLRKTSGWGVTGNVNTGDSNKKISAGQSPFVGYLSIGTDYGVKHEYGDYPFMRTIFKKNAEKINRTIVNFIKREMNAKR